MQCKWNVIVWDINWLFSLIIKENLCICILILGHLSLKLAHKKGKYQENGLEDIFLVEKAWWIISRNSQEVNFYSILWPFNI